jgi:CheY-like chemotaxis protein
MPIALIVEDEPEANKLLARLLQLRGYQTESAYDGAEALAKMQAGAPDVVFLDLMLPDMNGYDVCRSLKSCDAISRVPVVIVTARLTADNRIESFHVGADDYIPKPYTPDQIFEALEQSHAWKDQLAVAQVTGQVVLDLRDDGGTLRHLAHLRRLMQVRSGLGPEAVDRLSTGIAQIWSSAERWSRRHQVNQVASLCYTLTHDSLTLIVHDEAGWLDASDKLDEDHPLIRASAAGFDQIVADENAHSLTLVKRFLSP